MFLMEMVKYIKGKYPDLEVCSTYMQTLCTIHSVVSVYRSFRVFVHVCVMPLYMCV